MTTDQINSVVLTAIREDVPNLAPDFQRILEIILSHRPYIHHATELAKVLMVLPTTLISRFYRAGVPSPKAYITFARLIHVAYRLEVPRYSIGSTARAFSYSSPQAFSRTMRRLFHMSPGEFRRCYTGDMLVQLYRDRLIRPYAAILGRPLPHMWQKE